MADLAYSLASLEDTAADLRGLAGEFDDSGSYVDSRADAVGHSKVASAREDFVDGWERHREGLSKSLTSVGDMAQGCADGLRDTDDALRDELVKASSGAAR